MAAIANISIDASDLTAKLTMLQACMKPERFQRALYRIYNRTGKRVRVILQNDLPKQYAISPGKVGKAVMNAQVQGMGCIIPVRDKRGNIGSQYRASGGAHGWNSMKRKYRVKAHILAHSQSTLPATAMAGYPPFRNLGSSLGALTYTRTNEQRGPILRMSGIAIPQMPLNRSESEVQRDIHDWLKIQIEQEFMAMMRGY